MMTDQEILEYAKKGLYEWERELTESLANAPFGERPKYAKLLIKTHEQIEWVREEIRKEFDGEDFD